MSGTPEQMHGTPAAGAAQDPTPGEAASMQMPAGGAGELLAAAVAASLSDGMTAVPA